EGVREAGGAVAGKSFSPEYAGLGSGRTNSTSGDSTYVQSMQHFLAGVEAVSPRAVRTSGQGAQGGTARARFHQLGPVHGHAVLPVGTGAFVARDLRRSGLLRGAVEAFGGAGGTQEVHPGLCQ